MAFILGLPLVCIIWKSLGSHLRYLWFIFPGESPPLNYGLIREEGGRGEAQIEYTVTPPDWVQTIIFLLSQHMIGARQLCCYCHNTSFYCHKIQTKRFIMRTASDKKSFCWSLGEKRKYFCIFAYFVVHVKTIHAYWCIFRYAFWVLWVDEILKKKFKFGCSFKTAREPSGASVALLGSRLKVEIKPEMEARDQKNRAGCI